MRSGISWLCTLTAVVAVVLTGANYRTSNFTVSAPTQTIARNVGDAAEQFRRELALEWLGAELPCWSQPCPIRVLDQPSGPTGRTSFAFRRGQAVDWEMTLIGAAPAITENVLPHEVMHTVLASHFGRPLPRWADEGICTIVENPEEIRRHEQRVLQLLRGQQAFSLTRLFTIEQYPRDPVPFYMQSFSVSHYLTELGGRRHFIAFLDDGTRTGDWPAAVRVHYGIQDLAALENAWREVANVSDDWR